MTEATNKKAYKKVKRKYVTRWKILTILLLIGAVFSCITYSEFVGEIKGVMGKGDLWKMKNGDDSAIYYAPDFDNEEEMMAHGSEIGKLVEAEGAVLLKNENQALPLEKGSKVSAFSTSSVNLVYAGIGSGYGGFGSGVLSIENADTLKAAFEKVGFSVNDTLWNFYLKGPGSKYLEAEGKTEIHEAPWSVYTEEAKNSVSEYGDAAIIVLSRMGGQRADLRYEETNDLALDANEQEMIKEVCRMKEAGTVKKVIVLLNSAYPLEMGFLDEYPIDSCLWVGNLGENGINAVAEILVGSVNPSGGLTDTFCYDNLSSPAMWNMTPNTFEGYEKETGKNSGDTYQVYQEGIYVGYKYYETRYEDYVMGTGNAGDYDYLSTVAFPFGYGLSYTDFTYSDVQVDYNKSSDQFEVSVTVTNTGDTAGKKIAQVYVQSPYTQYDIDNGVEKSAVSLCGYGKTEILEPGESERLVMLVNKKDIASYDTYGAGTYIMDAGDYYLTVAEDAHEAVNNILAAKGYTPESTENRMTSDGNASLTYKWVEDKLDTTTYSVSANGTKIVNQLSVADPNLYDGCETDVTWLSRSDWEGTFPKERVKLTLTAALTENLDAPIAYNEEYMSMSMPVMGADNGLSLYDMIGKDFDDPEWDKLLDQLTYDEMVSLVSDACHFRKAVESVDAPGVRCENGPQGLDTFLILEDVQRTVFGASNVMSSTYNDQLIYQVGNVLGNNFLLADVTSLYGPNANLHRTPYGGRNFENYSEDGYLSGRMCAAVVRGIEDKGIKVLIKHFALNNCEVDRKYMGVWLNEQAAREIYLKAFQASFEEAGANGVMAAYTNWGLIGSSWNKGLMTEILRNEWGCTGWSITDAVYTPATIRSEGIMTGVFVFNSPFPFMTGLSKYEDDAAMVNAMREISHSSLYAIANSAAMNGIGEETSIHVLSFFATPIFRLLILVFGVLMIVPVVMWIRGHKKLKKTPEYQAYKGK